MIDEREIVQHAVDGLAPPEPSFERLVRRRERKNRNRRIAAGVAAIAVLIVPVVLVTSGGHPDPIPSPAAESTSSSQPAVEGIVGLPPEGATPSSPARGQQVLHFSFGHTSGDAGRFSLYLYADGRVIVQRIEGGPEVSSHGYLEQRLTPEGVDLVLAEVLSTGLLDRDRALEGSLGGLNSGGIAVRLDGRLTQLVWGATDFEEENKPAATAPTLDEVRALEALDTRLEDLTSWLPASAWEDPEVKPFVASRFSACYFYTGPDKDLGRLGVLDLLPPPAGDMIRPLDVTQSYPNGYRQSRPFWCSVMSTEQARQLVAVLPEAGSYLGGGGLSYDWSAGEIGRWVDLDLGPALP